MLKSFLGGRAIHNRHGRADGAALPSMVIRHDADFAFCHEFMVADSANLLDGFIFDDVGVAKGGGYLIFDFKCI